MSPKRIFRFFPNVFGSFSALSRDFSNDVKNFSSVGKVVLDGLLRAERLWGTAEHVGACLTMFHVLSILAIGITSFLYIKYQIEILVFPYLIYKQKEVIKIL
jgi:hypothetical protein